MRSNTQGLAIGRRTAVWSTHTQQLTAALCCVFLLLLWAGCAAAMTDRLVDLSASFRVSTGSTDLGIHDVRVRAASGSAKVTTRIDLTARFGPFVLYDYRHSAMEAWRDGQLIELDTRTHDDGEEHFVRAALHDGELLVETRAGRQRVPADVLPTSWWNKDVVLRRQLLDTQSGRLLEISSRRIGYETIVTPEGPLRAERWRIDGDLRLDLWYDARDRWVKTRFLVDGRQILYSPKLGEGPSAQGARS